MKKPTYLKSILVVLFILFYCNGIAQTYEPFTIRNNVDIKGSMLVIGNNILGQDNLPFNDLTTDNQDISMQYIDIDGDSSTFSSSSADILMPLQPDGTETTCYRVAYAALYWGAVLQSGSRADINQVKLKFPGSTTYSNITGEVIYDAIVNPIISETSEPGNTPYACYADVTNHFAGLTDIEGTYTVADVTSSLGLNNSTGLSAGWTLFIIYENPNLHMKSFTSFDGFSHIYDSHYEEVPVTGFTTPQSGNIDLQFAYATLDGDRTKRATKLEINGKEVTTPFRPANKFFGSVIENTNGVADPRDPMSLNTLGYDTGLLEINGAEPEYIKNNVSSASFTLQVARGQADPIFAFFSAFAVDIISPEIDLTKTVEDGAGVDINGAEVTLGEILFYEITYQNTGNDDVTDFTIKDVLPENVLFDPLTDIDLSNSGGVTLQSYDPATRTIIFSIPDESVEVNDPRYVIRLQVQVVPNCYDLSTACSNLIQNQAFATYRGVINTDLVEDEGSFANTVCLGGPESTNFLVDISNCSFQRDEVLCGASVVLTAADGYDSYSWSTSPTGTPVIGTGQTYTATETGTYYVRNTAAPTCISIDEAITVIPYGNTITNPIIPFADLLPICPNDGKVLPYIFLCGANVSRSITTGISDAVSIIWEQLDENSCPALTIEDCANENPDCTWNEVGTGPDYIANTSGQFRIVINYPGGCFSIFYFNVYQNLLNPTAIARDIICVTPGEITVGGVPSGYEYSLNPAGPFQSSNVFTINIPNFYTVYIRQIGVDTNPCVFQVPDVHVRQRDFTVTSIVTQPNCFGDKGSISLAANDVRPQYFFSIYEGATLVNSVGPIMENDYTFANLNAGTYTVNVSTEDGCVYSEDIAIIEPPVLTVSSALTQPLTCTDGEITVYPIGGTPPYIYYVNSTTDFQSSPIIPVTTPGIYNITVVDANNCEADTSITVDAILAPEFNITKTDFQCSDSGDSGIININVINANGNSLLYSIDNGVTFFSSPIFTGLAVGNYNVVVQYTIGSDVCVTVPQTITIIAPAPVTGIATLTTPYTCTTNGVITVSGVSGGTSPYTYSIDGITFQSGLTFSGLTNGTYTITIRDVNDCTLITTPITIDALNPPTDLDFSSTALTCPLNTSTVTLTTTDGVAPLEYQIIAPAGAATGYQTSNTFTGLAPDTYTFQVRDANDCIYSESYTIDALPVLTVVGQTISDVSCFGASDGEVRFTVSGSTGFTYSINGSSSLAGTSPIDLTNLSAGNYTIVITDTATNCDTIDTVTVNEPTLALSVTITVTPITCITDGSVTINAVGGWGGNTFTLTLPDTTTLPTQGSNIFTNLTQTGTYAAIVTDANGCAASTIFTLSLPTSPIATINTSSDFCYDVINRATLEVNASGGQAPYEYSMNGSSFDSINIFTNLTPGSYTITVRDSYGCTVVLPAVTIEPQLAVSAVLTKDLDCTISPDAIITGIISGGYGPFTYAVSINGGLYSALGSTGTPFTYITATDGTYQFQITDAQGCIAFSDVIAVNAISLPEITSVIQTQPILCSGDSNASIQVTINNTVGTPSFVINVNNDTTGTNYGTQTSGLPAGDYTITLTDSKSCTDVETITITDPDPISFSLTKVDITCNNPGGSSLGSLTVQNVTGGTTPFTYYVTNNFGDIIPGSPYSAVSNEDYTFNIINFGTYTVNVIDANGCSFLQQEVMASPPSDLFIDVTTIASDCATGGTATVQAVSAIGSGSFEFGILEFNSAPYTSTFFGPDVPGGDTRTFTNLVPGAVYTFVVHDLVTDCYFVKSADTPIDVASTLTSTVVPNNITCVGSNDGSVTFTIDNFDSTTTSVDYAIYTAFSNVLVGVVGNLPVTFGVPETLTTPSPGTLTPGQYYIVFTENGTGAFNGCQSATSIFEISESAVDLSVTASVDNNANCNPNSGVISAIGSNGTPPYLYQLTSSAIPPLATDPLWAVASTFNVNAGSYYVHVIDTYGCIKVTLQQIVPLDPEPVVSAVLTNQCTATEGNFEIDVTLSTVGIAPHSYSIDGGAFQTRVAPFTISNLSSGTHTIEVQDANGCGNLVSITIETPLGITPAITAMPTCLDNDGEITMTGYGGTGNYSYSISPNPVSIALTGNVFTGVPSGTYTITITDTTTLCTSDAVVSLLAATPVTFITTTTNVSCNGGNDGTITVNLPASNDNPIYTYEITAPIIRAPQTSNVFTGLAAGNYTVQVNSGRGCSNTEIVPITESPLLTVSGIATPYTCAADNSVNTSTVTITEVGGTAPFTYSIDGTNYFTTNIFDIVDTGAFYSLDIFVKDVNGCEATNPVAMVPLQTLTAAAVVLATPIDCNNTGSVSITITGGSGNFSYQMLPGGTPQASNTFSISTPGTYYFQINDLDTGCTIAAPEFEAAPYDIIDVIATPITAVACFGDNNGTFEIDINNYTGSYNYEVFDSSGTSVIGVISANTATNPEIVTSIAAGNYTVVVTETASPFCTATSNTITIESPISALTLVAQETSNVTCDNDKGTITATASGGWGGYEYELTGASTVAYASNGTFTNLSAGAYTINARDAGGCIVSENVTLVIPTPIDATATPSTTLLLCFGDMNATITVSNVTGGQGSNYTYTLNMVSPTASSSGPQTSQVFDGLGAGTYNITVTDGLNCQFVSADITITEPTQIEVDLVKATAQTCLNNATLTLSASGGTGPYEYSNSTVFTTVLGSFASSITFFVTDGVHVYYVRDSNGCISYASNEITINPLLPLAINLDTTNATINCAGDTTGVIVAIAEGGLGNYIYTLQDASGTNIPGATQNNPGVFTDLPVGTYQVRVDSDDCLTTSALVTITEPLLPLDVNYTVNDVTCNGASDGTFEISASGGTGIIKYAISPQLDQFFDEPLFENLAPGDYQAIAQDELGCFMIIDFTIIEPTPVILNIVPSSLLPEVCSGDNDGEFSIEISGGNLPYSVSLDDINGTYITGSLTQTQFDFIGLAGGDHLVYVRDALGCESEWNITFPESVLINPEVIIDYGCTNNISTNTVTINVDNSITNLADLDYSLNGGPYQTNNVFVNVPAGFDHYIDVRHTNGCIQRTLNFDITQFEPLTIVLEEGGLNEIVAIVTGGSGDYEFTLNGESYGSTNTFIIYESGDYTVTVIDDNGCELSASGYFEYVDVCISNYFTPNGDGTLDTWGPGCTDQYRDLTFDIFDRYGRKVASLRAGQKWDGRYREIELPTGDYWYVVKLNDKKDNRDFVGHFTLYR